MKTLQKKLNSINKTFNYPKGKILIYTNGKAPGFPNKFNKFNIPKTLPKSSIVFLTCPESQNSKPL